MTVSSYFYFLSKVKRYRKVTYANLFTSGNLDIFLAKVDRQAQERSHRLIEDMKQPQIITEHLKAENALDWIGKLNNIRANVRKIVNEEFIYI